MMLSNKLFRKRDRQADRAERKKRKKKQQEDEQRNSYTDTGWVPNPYLTSIPFSVWAEEAQRAMREFLSKTDADRYCGSYMDDVLAKEAGYKLGEIALQRPEHNFSIERIVAGYRADAARMDYSIQQRMERIASLEEDLKEITERLGGKIGGLV